MAPPKARSPTRESGIYSKILRLYHLNPHTGDYIGLLLLLLAYTILQALTDPFHRLFRLDDPRLQFPHAEHERVPVPYLFLYAGGVPLLVLVLWTVLLRPGNHKTHVTLLGLAITILLTSFITDIMKDAIGRPRPDLIARCKPDISAPQHSLVGVEVCTETDHHTLHDGWRSFPSGHSSFAFAGLGYLACFLASQTNALRPRASLVTILMALAPLLGAAMIAASRLEDYRHDFADVITGSWIGMIVAYINWRRYYPGLLSQGCEEPHPCTPVGGKDGVNGFQRVRDEEEGYGSAGERFSVDDDGIEGYSRNATAR
ncbi:hypothetical protein LTR56_023163 [Elasticomyces elasticus]|nr:hypothetical protein LTR56_023163 [Elasticomyces elasticus]KAK3647428.1 hypothetical protein LTR22_013721 [Elasticomyces elasticus]KAK4906949.1 hypothetical protein LTR49_023982 [Elasticomyces elasticus]KAK5750178.1 hypothetical protein LTS12_019742 [Elasticomyces elasticus]